MIRFARRCLFLSLLLLSGILPAREAGVVPIDQEPSHHQVLDNEYVRVFDVTVAPHSMTLMHRHDRDYIFVTLGASHISNERMNEKPAEIRLQDGDIRYTKGSFAHVARNLAEAPFHNITIELKNPGAPVCGIDPSPACKNDDKGATTLELFQADHLIVRLTTLQPGQQTPLHTHPSPHFAVALDDLTFENHVENKPAATFSMSKGQYAWVSEKGVTHYFKNVGKEPARMMSLEFK